MKKQKNENIPLLEVLKNKWNIEKEKYKKKEVGTGVETFVEEIFLCPLLFNLIKGLETTEHKNRKFEYTKQARTKTDNSQADFVIFIDGLSIVIPVEVELYQNIKAGEKQLLRYQLAWDKRYGILTDGFTWRFYNNTQFREFEIDYILNNSENFIVFWNEYIKPENYYISFFEQEQINQSNNIAIEENKELFFEDITKLIDNFKNKLNIAEYFTFQDKNVNEKKATEITYAYFIQFILYKSLVDNCYSQFNEEFKQRLDSIYKSLKAEVYDAILNNIRSISKFISAELYKPFSEEQSFINQRLEEVLQKPKNTLIDISLWLDIIVFISKYSFANIKNDIFGYIYENYLKDLYEDTKKGQYFTDPALVNFMLDEIGFTKENILKKYTENKTENLSIIDPSCGSGTFLYSATDRIIDALFDAETETKAKFVENTINQNIFGLDIAEFPLYLSEMNILMRMLPLIINEKYNNPVDKKINVFKTKDSISEFLEIQLQANPKKVNENLLNLIFEDIKLGYDSYIRNEDDLKEMKSSLIPPQKRFDYVIGNPPYIDYNECSKQEMLFTQLIKNKRLQMSDVFGINLNTVPKRVKPYSPKPNLYSFFIALGFSLLKKESKICYIIPQTILTATDLDVLRYYFAKDITIDKIITFEGQMFVGRGLKQKKPVATSSLIFIATKKVPNKEHKVKITNFANYKEPEFENFLKNSSPTNKEIVQSELLKSVENWKFIVKDNKFLEIIKTYRKNGITIDAFRRKLSHYDELILDGSVNINKKDLSTINDANSYNIPIINKKRKKITEFLYCNETQIKKAQGSRDFHLIAQRQYKILWQYQNPSGFYFVDRENSFPKFMEYCIASNNKQEILFLYSLLSSNVNDWYLKSLLVSETEKSYLLGLRTLKEFLRIPIITNENIEIKNEIIKQTEFMFDLETKSLSDFVDFKNVQLQKFDKIEIIDNYLVLNKENTQIKAKIVSNSELIKLVINNLETDKIISLSEMKQLPVIDNDFQSEIKQYIDNLIFSLYFDVKLSKIGFENKDKIQIQISESVDYKYIFDDDNKK